MVIYIDADFKCHTSNDGSMREVETDAFDGKCPWFIEGYRFIPAGESWTRSDGVVFTGEMVSPWKDYSILCAYQEQFEESQIKIVELEAINADQTTALNTIYEGVTE